MRRALATATIAALCILPAVLIPFDVFAFDFVGMLAVLCVSPVALVGAIALTDAMGNHPLVQP